MKNREATPDSHKEVEPSVLVYGQSSVGSSKQMVVPEL